MHILASNISVASSVMHVFSFHRLFTYKKWNKKTKKCLLLQNTVGREKKRTNERKKRRKSMKIGNSYCLCVCASVFRFLQPMLFHENENQKKKKRKNNVEKLVIYDQNAYITLQSHGWRKTNSSTAPKSSASSHTMRANDDDDEWDEFQLFFRNFERMIKEKRRKAPKNRE